MELRGRMNPHSSPDLVGQPKPQVSSRQNKPIIQPIWHGFLWKWGTSKFDGLLVGGSPTPLKNMKVSWDYKSQLNGKIKFVFQTTNQFISVYHGSSFSPNDSHLLDTFWSHHSRWTKYSNPTRTTLNHHTPKSMFQRALPKVFFWGFDFFRPLGLMHFRLH